MPSTRAPTPTPASGTLTRSTSSVPGDGGVSGSQRRPRTSATPMTGMLIKNTAATRTLRPAARRAPGRLRRRGRRPHPDRSPSGAGRAGRRRGPGRDPTAPATHHRSPDDTGADQHLAGHGDTGEHAADQEDRNPCQEDPFVAVALRHPPADQQQAGHADVVGAENPRQHRLRGVSEAAADLGKRERDDGDLHADHEDRER